MLWSAITELSLCFGLILIILYGLFSMAYVQPSPSTLVSMGFISVPDVYFFSRLWPLMLLLGYSADALFDGQVSLGSNGIDILLIILTIVIMQSFKSFESTLLLLLAFIGQLFMLHSCDLVSFYVCLEAQNFCFLVLCGLQPRAIKTLSISKVTPQAPSGLVGTGAVAVGSRPLAGVEASIKYLLLSAFSSGVLLFWFSVLYLRTGMSSLSTLTFTGDVFIEALVPQMLILIALMFKLGGAPLHIWMVDIYSGVKRQLLMYLATAPKLSLFGFWVSTWHSVWTDFTVFLFVALSMIIGCFGAYNQPTLRAMFAYSTINEIGLMLMAIETAGFHSLFQHLTIYIITMLLLWNLSDKRLFALLAISLAGLPPLAGFFGKAWIFQSVAVGALAGPYIGLLLISLFCTGLSLVYYLRVFRLFSMSSITNHNSTNNISNTNTNTNTGFAGSPAGGTVTYSWTKANSITSYKLTSFCVIFLIFAPLFYIKPFVL